MKLRAILLALAAGAILPSGLLADSIPLSTTVTSPTLSFTATVTSQELDASDYTSSTFYQNAVTAGFHWNSGPQAGENVYLYEVTSSPTSMENLETLTVNTGVGISQSPTITSFGGSSSGLITYLSHGTFSNEVVNFANVDVAPGGSVYLAFAYGTAPGAFSGSVADGSSANVYPLISASGQAGGGTPLPVPASAFGGLALGGLLLGSRTLKKVRRSA